MKLFEVEVTTVVCVWAEDRRSAENKAEMCLDDVMLHNSNTAVLLETVALVPYQTPKRDAVI